MTNCAELYTSELEGKCSQFFTSLWCYHIEDITSEEVDFIFFLFKTNVQNCQLSCLCHHCPHTPSLQLRSQTCGCETAGYRAPANYNWAPVPAHSVGNTRLKNNTVHIVTSALDVQYKTGTFHLLLCVLPLTCVYSYVSDKLAGLFESFSTMMAAVCEPATVNVFLVVSGTRIERPVERVKR